MIDRLEITNFKRFGKLVVNGLQPLTLIGGGNNVGKTTLLEAIFLCFNRSSDLIIDPLRDSRALNRAVFDYLFHNSNTQQPFSISCRDNAIDYRAQAEFNTPTTNGDARKSYAEIATENSAASGRPASIDNMLRLVCNFSIADEYSNQLTCWLDAKGMRSEFKNVENPPKSIVLFRRGLLGIPRNQDADDLGKLDVEGRIAELLDILRIIVPNVQDIAVVPNGNNSIIYVQTEGQKQKFPVVLLGSGACKIILLALRLLILQDAIVLLDEATVGWHYSKLSELWRALGRIAITNRNQIIATTHSYEGIEAFADAAEQEGITEKVAFIRLDASATKDEVKAKVFDYDEIDVATRSNWELR